MCSGVTVCVCACLCVFAQVEHLNPASRLTIVRAVTREEGSPFTLPSDPRSYTPPAPRSGRTSPYNHGVCVR